MKYLSWICLLALGACNPSKNMKQNQAEFPAFDAEAHRGGRGLMPENTVVAMLDALDRGVNTLEMDVHITRDKQVILSHDPYFNADITTTPEGRTLTKKEGAMRVLYQMDLDSIQKYDVGLKGHPGFPQQEKVAAIKPLLSEVLVASEVYAQKQNRALPWYNIETKSKPSGDGKYHPAPAEFVELLMGVVKKAGVEERTVIQSFDPRTLQVLHQKYPHMKTSLLIGQNEERSLDQQLRDLGFTPFVYSPHYKLVTPQLVKETHKKGMKIVPWTANTKEEIESLKAMGVDGIITDYPNLF